MATKTHHVPLRLTEAHAGQLDQIAAELTVAAEGRTVFTRTDVVRACLDLGFADLDVLKSAVWDAKVPV